MERASRRTIRSLFASSCIILLLSSLAMAQAPGGEMDLPIQPPKLGGDNGFQPPEGDDDGDDPNDTPPPVIYGEEIDSENDTIFYVIDQSCSMGWGHLPYTTLEGSTSVGPRMDRAKTELNRSISGLAENFKFNIVSYDCATRLFAKDMVEANEANKQAAVAWVNKLKPAGATGTGPATALSLGDKENMSVVLLTDGAPNCGANNPGQHRVMIISANTQGATINVFGIAANGSYRAFCQGVASDSGGSYFDVP